ncbi:hypothetical protein SAMN00768000_3725 [Sulfobacillus thermosulfidooxidans DSM 9293]|uniref:TraG P-loop domain-containing protein n=2 Tax=Sulfobacillus thermosulfidooxidans TaxID=28034 RepID=A0A1W1WPM3_SULTA|nr:hypothetical protein [Sulfobacillus thermosulfidooxidans]SMC08186.1 hypothetical protein SAMN00768000_3725 [Sulfobacillus thermosulfidooxidans DSM 9293]
MLFRRKADDPLLPPDADAPLSLVDETPPTQPVAPPPKKRRWGRQRPAPDPAALSQEAHRMVPSLSEQDLLIPAGWQEKPTFVEHGEGYYSASLRIMAYPAQASNGFLHGLLRAPMPRRFAFYITPISNGQIVKQLTDDVTKLEAKLRGQAKEGKPFNPYDQNAYQQAEQLRQALAKNWIKMFNTSFIITLFGQTPEELQDHIREFKEAAAGGMWYVLETYYEHGNGWLTTLPLADERVTQSRRLDSNSLSCMLPFTWTEHIEEGGLYVGTNVQTGGPVLLDIHNRHRYPAGHIIFIAPTRSGKSYTAKSLLVQSLLDPALDAFVIDPSPPIDYQALGQTLGRFIPFKVGTQDKWNLCAIEYPRHITQLDENERQLLTAKIDFLLTLIDLMIQGQWTLEERALTEDLIRQVYGRYGITNDPVSLIDPDTLSVHPRMKPMPKLRDMVQALLQHPQLNRIGIMLKPFIQGGTLDLFDGDVPPSALDSRLTVFNIEGLLRAQKHLQPVAYLVIGELIQQRLLQSGRRTIIMIDEAHILFANEGTALWLSRLFRMSAKLNSAVWLLTQSLVDMIGDPATGLQVPGQDDARVCLSNTSINWLGPIDKESDARLLAQEFNLSGAEVEFLRKAQKGLGIWRTNRFHVPVQGQAPAILHPLLSSTLDEKTQTMMQYPDPLQGRQPMPAEVGEPMMPV